MLESSKRCWLTTPSTMPAWRAVSIMRRAVATLGGNGLLHLDVLAGLGADLERLQAEIREGADIHEVHLRVAADLLVRADEFGAVLSRELRARPPR